MSSILKNKLPFFKGRGGNNPKKNVGNINSPEADGVPNGHSKEALLNANKVFEQPAASSITNDVVSINWTSQPVYKPGVHGLQNEILALRKLLERRENDNDNQFKAIGVVGTMGIGKTTLVQEYFNLLGEEKDGKLFLPRIRVSMSSKSRQNDNGLKKTTVKKVLENLGVEIEKIISEPSVSTQEDPNKLLKGLLYVLRLQLMGKRYLIVLDDVTENTDDSVPLGNRGSVTESTLAYGLPKGYGGTVMVTSRTEEVIKTMVGDERNVHRLLPLSDPNSLWSIFCDAVIKGVIDDDEGGEDEGYKLKKLLKSLLREKMDDYSSLEKTFEDMLRDKCYEELAFSGTKIDVKKVIKEKLINKCNGIPLVAKLTAKSMTDQILAWLKEVPSRKASKQILNWLDKVSSKKEEQKKEVDHDNKILDEKSSVSAGVFEDVERKEEAEENNKGKKEQRPHQNEGEADKKDTTTGNERVIPGEEEHNNSQQTLPQKVKSQVEQREALGEQEKQAPERVEGQVEHKEGLGDTAGRSPIQEKQAPEKVNVSNEKVAPNQMEKVGEDATNNNN